MNENDAERMMNHAVLGGGDGAHGSDDNDKAAVFVRMQKHIRSLEEENAHLRNRLLELEEQSVRRDLLADRLQQNHLFNDRDGVNDGENNNDARHARSSVPLPSSSSSSQSPSAAAETEASWTRPSLSPASSSSSFQGTLDPSQIERYSRQLLLQHGGFGVEGQQKLMASSVLVIGAGGIGSTVLLYLAAAGVGHITIVDFDHVDVSNLHRQVIHSTQNVGMNKAESARRAVQALNPLVECHIIQEPLVVTNAMELISQHDCIVDASDNPQTRYLINDACVLSGKPLVSGSAMGVEGQLTVYNFELKQPPAPAPNDETETTRGPCYRCLYPTPNAAEGSKSCSDNGVLGPVPGLIGILQAVETIKILTGSPSGHATDNVLFDRLLMYDASTCSFLRIKKPPRQAQCPVCGTHPTITSMEKSHAASLKARGPSCSVNLQPFEKLVDDASMNVSCHDYQRIRMDGVPHILLDVRVKEQFDLCHLKGAVNVPLESIQDRIEEVLELSENGTKSIYCLCRRGIASVAAANILHKVLASNQSTETTTPSLQMIRNVNGGLNAWRAQVDGSFPKY